MHEDIHLSVSIARYQVTGRRVERDMSPVGADGRRAAAAVCLRTVGGDAYPNSLTGLAIVEKHIHRVVGVARGQVARR